MPHAPQLPGSVDSSTHAVGPDTGHPVKLLLHVKVHAPLTHAGCELLTVSGQTLLQPLQSLGLLVVSTQVPLHSSGVPVGQPVTQVPPAQTGVLVGQVLVHEPQLAGVVMFTSQPLSGLPSQSAQPVAHADGGNEHAPAAVHEVAPDTCGRSVQLWPHVPQLLTSLGTQLPLQSRSPLAHVGEPASEAPVSVVASAAGPVSPAELSAITPASPAVASGCPPSAASVPSAPPSFGVSPEMSGLPSPPVPASPVSEALNPALHAPSISSANDDIPTKRIARDLPKPPTDER